MKLAPGKSRGLEVRARKGYYAPSDDGKPTPEQKKGVDPVFQAALDSPWVQDGIPLRMTDYVGDEKMMGKAAVRLTAELDPRSVQFEEKEGRSYAELDFLMVVAHRQTGEYFRYDQSYNLKLLPTTRERLTRLWMPIVRDFELAPGEYQAKVIVRDKRSGRVGSLMHEFEVPALDQFRTSTPVLSDTRAATPSEEGVPGGMPDPARAPRVRQRLGAALPVRGLRGEEGRADGDAPRAAGIRRQAPRRQRARRHGPEHDQADVARPPLPDDRVPARRRAAR